MLTLPPHNCRKFLLYITLIFAL